MINLSLLYTYHSRPLSVAVILDFFETVNSIYVSEQLQPVFNITLVTDDEKQPACVQGSYHTQKMSAIGKTDLILIPAFNFTDMGEAIRANQPLIPWICQQHYAGVEIASFCTGAFLLAATGLLNGKKATTHVMGADGLATNFPLIRLQPEAVLTHDDGIYTSGGATNTFHLLLYLAEKFCGGEKSVQTAKMFAIDMDRNRQNYFATFSPVKNHKDLLVNKAQVLMESNYGQSATIEGIISGLPSSRRNFVRRFKIATGITPIEYLQRTRMEAAKKMLEKTNQNVREVMYQTGYNDLKAFRQVFKKEVGLTPKEYRDKFNYNNKSEAKV